MCLERFSRSSVPILRLRVLGNLGVLRWVAVVPPSVPVVTVPFSNVNVVCEKVCSDSDCEVVEPH